MDVEITFELEQKGKRVIQEKNFEKIVDTRGQQELLVIRPRSLSWPSAIKRKPSKYFDRYDEHFCPSLPKL